MTQRKIFEVLSELNDLNDTNSSRSVLNEFSDLKSKEFDVISSGLSQIVYATNKEANITSNLRRNQIINLIKNLTQTPQNHFNVTKQNHNLIFKKILTRFESNLGEKELGNDLRTFYAKSDEKCLRINQKLEFVLKRDQEMIKNDDFDVNINLNRGDTKSFDEIYFDLTQKKYRNNLEINCVNENDFTDLIKLLYAWCNLNGDYKELKNVLKLLKSYSERFKDCDEIKKDLIWCIWNDISSQDDLKLILEEFPFILEQKLIQVSKKIVELETFNVQDFFESEAVLAQLLQEDCLKRTALLILYELFALSGYNRRILSFIEDFNKTI
nr:uncharacterized protein LOC111413099 [Onthophagus taurus]XP_022899722.1 uncharacterized protein LOC111413099 [Onthophagus taurus]